MTIKTFKLEYPGIPSTYKNHKEIVRAGKFHKIQLKKRTRLIRDKAAIVLSNQWAGKPLTELLHVRMLFFGPWVLGKCTSDLDNLIGLPLDALQRAGVILDDKQVLGLDGSRKVHMCGCCPDLKWMPRNKMYEDSCKKKKACKYTKTVIFITTLKQPKELTRNVLLTTKR